MSDEINKEDIDTLVESMEFSTPEGVLNEAVNFRKRANEIHFRHDLNELEELRSEKLKEFRVIRDNILIREQKFKYTEALIQFEHDTARALQVRRDKTFEPAKWFEIETGNIGPKVFAMSIDGGTVLSIGSQGSVYCPSSQIYKVKDKYYLRADNKW